MHGLHSSAGIIVVFLGFNTLYFILAFAGSFQLEKDFSMENGVILVGFNNLFFIFAIGGSLQLGVDFMLHNATLSRN